MTSFVTLTADPKYKPRMENCVRFNTIDLPTYDGVTSFNGIIHGFIFPQNISDVNFEAKVISSDDAYPDGIWSYYSIACSVSP